MKLFNLTLIVITLFTLSSCTQLPASHTEDKSANYHSLKDAYQGLFKLGVAINQNQATNKDQQGAAIAAQHFSVLTPENDMKWESIEPNENQFTWQGADALISFAARHNQSVIGHTLVWHSQTPDWVFEVSPGVPASRELLLQRMQAHINALAGRYKGKIVGWDVVNEALNEDGSLRDSKWRQIIGDDFIEKAFEFASKAAPNAELYYNDYNLFKPEKRAGAVRIAANLLKKGIRIDGIGEQAHYDLNPPVQQLNDSIEAFASLGLKVMITELDISVLKFPDESKMGADVSLNFALQESFNPYSMGLPMDVEKKLYDAYASVFEVLLKHHKVIDRVTFWGVTDADSWRNGWPMKGRTDYPLLIDRNHQVKPFVSELLKAAQNFKSELAQ
ncbi:endo-1,4-beta-xylanase [uncultured Paraglaciecola sp.]|uniref:endo-1,4-beta-xylanase n=1 Tax=uncultured Paraglaciecola sp. TaxID=1765024 RepID=UPI0030D71F07|tara:strand:- start:38825 stop:39991 length:1167 start_codon:yes stop_codon:yes gene_type:complete